MVSASASRQIVILNNAIYCEICRLIFKSSEISPFSFNSYNDWEEKRQDCQDGAVIDLNQTAHMWVKCRLTCHRLCCLLLTLYIMRYHKVTSYADKDTYDGNYTKKRKCN